MTKTTDKK